LRFKIFQPVTMGISPSKRGFPIQWIEVAFGWSLIGPDPMARYPHRNLPTHSEPHKRFRTHRRVIDEASDREKRDTLRESPIHFVEHIFIGAVLLHENAVNACPNAARQRGLTFRKIVRSSCHIAFSFF